MAGNNRGIMLSLATVVLSAIFGISSAKTVIVGGSTTGWNIPPSPSFYPTWASQQNLQVGDVLVFNFPAGAHTVAEVTKSNYDSCTTTSTIGPIITTAPANITLTKPGSHYFICTIPTHCSSFNQKLTVTTASSSVTAPAPKASPPSKKSQPPSPKPSPVPTPTSSPVPAPSTSPMPITPAVPGPNSAMVPAAGGIGSSPPPAAGSFAASTGVTMLSLLSFIVASALLF